MNEKYSVSDILSSVNSIINKLNYAIEQANNTSFRNVCINYRNTFENIQKNIYEIAKDKGYYVPAAKAGTADLDAVKQTVQNS